MNILEKIKNAKVEWKKLGEVANFRRGSFPQPYGEDKWYGGDGAMPFVQVADVDENMKLHTTTKRQISKLAQPQSIFVPKGTVIVTLQGTIGRVAITQYDSYIDRTLGIFESFKIEINKKYFAYQLKRIFDMKKRLARGSTIKTITKEEFSSFQIPIPPLEIQEEIVRILDNFTELTAELTAELSLRKKQYQYYLNKLLTFGDEVEWKKLGEVLVRTKGTKITAKRMKEIHKENAPIKIFAGGKTVAYVDYGDIPDKDINYEPSIIVKSRGIIEFEYYDKPFSHKSEMWSYHSKDENIDIKFVYYFLKTKEDYFRNIASKMQMPQISILDTQSYLVPIPPLEVQKEIVSILDKFDTLTNSISEGLPREIELRQKQYEYYRDLLLRFEG